MKLFDSGLGKINNNANFFTNKESFAGMIVAMAAASGNISNYEIEDLKLIIYKSKTLNRVNDYEYSNIIKKVFKVLRTKGVDTLLNLSMAGLSKELYEGVFASVCDLAYSDGLIEKEEKRLMEKIRISFNISNEKALAIVNVITVKNNV